jgi:hypothetical protein
MLDWFLRALSPEHTDAAVAALRDVADGLVYAQFHHTHQPTGAVSLMLDFHTGHALSVVTKAQACSSDTPLRTCGGRR